MRYELKDYQRDAAITVLDRLRIARNCGRTSKMPSSFALSAITGAGQNSHAAAVLRRSFMVHLISMLSPTPDDILWITDRPPR